MINTIKWKEAVPFKKSLYSYHFKSQIEICPKNLSIITPLNTFSLIQPYGIIWKGTDEQPKIKFGKKITADLSRHTVLMNERMEVKWFSVYLSSVVHGTVNYPPCQSVAYLFSQMVCRILGYFHITTSIAHSFLSGNLCVLMRKKDNISWCLMLTEHQIIMCFIMNIIRNFMLNEEIETPLKYKYLKGFRQTI